MSNDKEYKMPYGYVKETIKLMKKAKGKAISPSHVSNIARGSHENAEVMKFIVQACHNVNQRNAEKKEAYDNLKKQVGGK